MIIENFIWLALLIALIGGYKYIRDTLKGDTKPNRVTFFLWGAAPLISFIAQKSGGGGKQITYTLIISIMAFAIFLASFVNPNAYWKVSKFDIACGLVSLFALILLIVTGDAILALIFSILGDFFAALPTLIKSYKFPATETVLAYALDIISSIIILLTITDWHFTNYCFALYILFMNSVFTGLLLFSPKKIKVSN